MVAAYHSSVAHIMSHVSNVSQSCQIVTEEGGGAQAQKGHMESNSFREGDWESKWGFSSADTGARSQRNQLRRRNRRFFKERTQELWLERPTRHKTALSHSFAERERRYTARKAQELCSAEEEAASRGGSLYMPQFETRMNDT